MPASARKFVGSSVSSKMVGVVIQSTGHSNNTASRENFTLTDDGGREGDGDGDEVEDGGEEDGSEDEDQVTETGLAQSLEGKKPVYHHEIYDRLVNLTSRQGAYTYEPPDHGIDSMDVTSFRPDQRDWSATRAHRPPILTLWSETPGSAPTYAVGCLLFNGRLILDYAGNPIRAFRNLPLTISSAVKGFRLETWIRQDFRRLRVNDILARLRTRNTPNGRQPLQRRGDLTDRTNAFRLKSGLIPFRPYNSATRLGARNYIDSLRTAAQRASNLATDRDLTSNQLNTLKKLGKRGPVNAAAGSSASVSASASVNAPTIISSPIATITSTTATPTTATPTSVTPTIVISTSRPTRRRRRSPAPQPASSPLPTPTIDPTLPDSRDDVPETCKESYILQEALEETVEHFKKMTGKNPKHTNTAESYSSQWNALQMQFAPIWKTQRPREDTPLLFKLRAWIGGIKRWDSDWRTQVGGAKRDREGRSFGKHMDATTEGTAYLGRDGGWRSVRDTRCDSHVNPSEARAGGRDSTSDEDSEEDPEEGSEEDTEEISEEGSEEESDDEFDDAQ